MCANFNIVPWYDSEEWLRVYRDIYSDNSNKQGALNLLLTWKARCPFLPSGIESTLCLLQVHLQDENSSDNVTNDQILRLAYSSALMRFVNHMLDTETVKGVSLYQAAKTLGVPDWIIDLRHNTAHSNNLPSLALLRSACSLSLQWLQCNYWDQYKQCIQDYICGTEEANPSDENKIVSLIHFYSCLSICKHMKIKKLSDIPDPEMQLSIVNDAREFLGAYTNFSNLKTVSLTSLTNLMSVHSKKYLNTKNTPAAVNKALLGDDSLFLSLELVDFLTNKTDFHCKHKLSRNYVQCFEVLLTFLHTNNLILDFLLALIELTQIKKDHKMALLAALWVSEILKALKISKKFLEKAKRMHSDNTVYNTKKNLIMMYHHWFPNEKINGIVLDLTKPVPNKLTNLNFILPIVSSYNPYLTYFINDLLVLVEPNVPNAVKDKVCKLAKLISTPEEFPVQLKPAKIYTVDDLDGKDDMQDGHEMDIDNIDVTNRDVASIWKIASKKLNWGSSPIGQLPSDINEVGTK